MAKRPDTTKTAVWILRIGLAFVFLYAAVSMLHHPLEWTGYMPGFLTKFVAATSLVKLFAGGEIILAVWLLTGKFTRYAAAMAALWLIGIVLTNTSEFIVTFRDVGLACMAAALAILSD